MPSATLLSASAAAVLLLGAATALAQPFPHPGKSIRLLVGFPPGGSTDLLARSVGSKLGEQLGVQVVVDNRAGAAGNVAAELAARGNPDGYTLLMATVSSHAINPALYRSIPYDPIGDYAPVSLVASYPLILAVNPTLGVKTVSELVALARQKPGTLNFSSSGNGSPGHLAGELFKMLAKVDMAHIPYKGGAPATAAVLANEAQLIFATLPGAIGFIKSGKLIGPAVTTAKRSAALPDVPTIAESGLPGFAVSSWAGLVAPARTPRAVTGALREAVVKSLAAPDLRERLARDGADPVGSTPDEFGAFIKSELAQWRKVVQQAKAQID
ncbi:MAG: tripartite tricarboxylate transporter substrate binding protein [Burkholderiales bacterium]|nr:tripartite tricarboxylate transporter substrate binding protein [Burkholderiales bacterium]